MPGEMEVLLGDAIIEGPGIEMVKPRSGLWRFAGEGKSGGVRSLNTGSSSAGARPH